MKRTTIIICALISMWTAGPVFASANSGGAQNGGGTPTSATVATTTPSRAERATETASYAAREKAAPELVNFQGGDGAGIYIGGSTLAVVLLIVLLIILL